MLTPEGWRLAEEIFHEAAARPAGERAALIESRCQGDEEIRREVLSLLDAEARGGLDESLVARAAADWSHTLSQVVLGREIGGYRVKSALAAGGMGEAYLAEDISLGRLAVLKFLPRAFGSDERRVRRFLEEARSASALNHPGILTVYGAGSFEGHRYIAAEFIDGETLRQRLSQGPLSPAEALDIAIQAAEALGAAHRAGIIHRDIKPENLMIRRDGYVKIIDFGLARPIQSGDQRPRGLTLRGDVLGTADYMAPEQAAAGPVDARADLYSLNVVLGEMLTGQLPREWASGSDGKAPAIPPAAMRVLRRGLASDPGKRHQTAAELQRDLEELRSRGTWKHRLLPWAAAAVLFIAASIGGLRWWTASHSPAVIRSLVVMPLRGLGAADQAHLEEGMSDAIITRLSSLPQLRVPPAAAIRANEDPFDAARRLRVDAVLTGSVQRSGDRLRVTAQLSQASDRRQIWSAQYDEDFTGIFAIQDAIAGRVAESLVKELSPHDRQALTRHESQNSAAYDLYLQARDRWAQRTPASIHTAIRMFQQAIAIEPGFALAWAGLADSYNLAASGMAPLTRGPLAKAAAARALTLDPSSAEAHTAIAFEEYKFEWKWEEADREFQRAIELNSHYALAHHWYGEFLKLRGRHEESIRQFQQAVEADPFSIPIRYDFILALLEADRVGEARTMLEESRAIDPNAIRVARAETEVLTAEGRGGEAMEARLRADLLAGGSEKEVNALRREYRAGGERRVDESMVRTALAGVKPAGEIFYSSATSLADLYARLGDRERTLLWLHKAADLHEDAVLLLLTHRYDFLRKDAEFVALEKRVGLAP